ncbi:MAG: hypothetical protein M1342_01710 [Patescibacteria group bacterium]|nr:hypothetical protein [Patescibacteria group bacterium]
MRDNQYLVSADTRFISRCIDGRYPNDSNLPALAVPGADAGELALVLATANSYALTANQEKIWQTLVEVVGGSANLRFHTDAHCAGTDKLLDGCGHLRQMAVDLEAYNLTQSQFNFIGEKFNGLKKSERSITVLNGDHQEEGVLLIKGNRGIYPQHCWQADNQSVVTQVFVYHATLAEERRRRLSNLLVKNKAVIIPEGCDGNYLYGAIDDMGENHLMETLRRLAKGLPIYQVSFADADDFRVEEMGRIE